VIGEQVELAVAVDIDELCRLIDERRPAPRRKAQHSSPRAARTCRGKAARAARQDALVDLDGDKDLDALGIVVISSAQYALEVNTLQARQLAETKLACLPGFKEFLGTGDFDGNGQVDIAYMPTAGTISVLTPK